MTQRGSRNTLALRRIEIAAQRGLRILWRLHSYWRFEQKDGGVFIECCAISLTRDIPPTLAWIIKPIVRKLPKQSLVHTLEATRNALTFGWFTGQCGGRWFGRLSSGISNIAKPYSYCIAGACDSIQTISREV